MAGFTAGGSIEKGTANVHRVRYWSDAHVQELTISRRESCERFSLTSATMQLLAGSCFGVGVSLPR